VRPGGQREKGKTFERKIARIIRDRWPEALVRRASQAERAHNPDVFVEGGPSILQRLWMELQDSAHPTPIAKLDQAVRDVEADPRSYNGGCHRLPVAITHKLGSPAILATMNVGDLMDILDPDRVHAEDGNVSMPLETFLDLVERGADRRAETEAA
jgi:hypothetical protein